MSWRSNGTRIEDSSGRVVCYMTPWSTEADARKIAAVDDAVRLLKMFLFDAERGLTIEDGELCIAQARELISEVEAK